jgi:hypothetical protein
MSQKQASCDAPRHAEAVDRRDHRLGMAPDLGEPLDVGRLAISVRNRSSSVCFSDLIGVRVDVIAGREGAPGASDDHDLGVAVLQIGERIGGLVPHRRGQCVEPVGPVQPQPRDRPLAVDEQF